MKTTLPTDSEERKNVPVYSGCLKYIPAAIAGMARISKSGNDKHNPGEPLHHSRGKSSDHGDCIMRHLMDVSDIVAAFERMAPMGPTPDQRKQLMDEVDQLFWRAGAFSQELHEKYDFAPLAPGAKLPESSNLIKGEKNQAYSVVQLPGARQICQYCGADVTGRTAHHCGGLR